MSIEDARIAELEARVAELSALLTPNPTRKNPAWEQVKAMTKEAFPEQRGPRGVRQRHRVTDAISAILRSRYSINNIARLPEENADEIYALSKTLVAVATGKDVAQ